MLEQFMGTGASVAQGALDVTSVDPSSGKIVVSWKKGTVGHTPTTNEAVALMVLLTQLSLQMCASWLLVNSAT